MAGMDRESLFFQIDGELDRDELVRRRRVANARGFFAYLEVTCERCGEPIHTHDVVSPWDRWCCPCGAEGPITRGRMVLEAMAPTATQLRWLHRTDAAKWDAPSQKDLETAQAQSVEVAANMRARVAEKLLRLSPTDKRNVLARWVEIDPAVLAELGIWWGECADRTSSRHRAFFESMLAVVRSVELIECQGSASRELAGE